MTATTSEQHLRAIVQRNCSCGIDIAHGEETQPGRLAMLARRDILVSQSCDQTAVEKCRSLCDALGLNAAECPAKQPRIELLGGGEVRRHQLDKYEFAGVMLLAGGLDNRRQLERCGCDRHGPHNAENRGEQPWAKPMSGSLTSDPVARDTLTLDH